MSDTKYYEESDIGISAYLMFQGKELVHVSAEPPRYRFVFNDTAGDCNKLATDYISSPFKAYDNCIRDIRTRLHVAKSNKSGIK